MPEIITCSECGKETYAGLQKCPHCQLAQESQQLSLKDKTSDKSYTFGTYSFLSPIVGILFGYAGCMILLGDRDPSNFGQGLAMMFFSIFGAGLGSIFGVIFGVISVSKEEGNTTVTSAIVFLNVIIIVISGGLFMMMLNS